MLTVSDSFKQAMHQSTKSLRSRVVVDNTTTISDNDSLISFAIESDGYLFGSAVSIASVKLLDTHYDLVGRTIELKTSTKTDQTNNTWEELSLGEFQVIEQQVDLEKGMTTLKCFDSLIALSKIPYIAGELAFPSTIANTATQLATRRGLIIDESVANLPNASQVIAEDPYAKISNLTYRDILNEIAGATGTMAIIKNGKLYFQPAQKTPLANWTYDHLKKIKFKPKYGPISSVVLARTPQEDNVALTDDAVVSAPATKNLISFEDVLFNGIKTTVNSDGSLNCVGTTTASYFNLTRWQKTLPKRLPTGRYTLSRINNLNERLSISLWNTDKTKTKQIILEPNSWQLTSELDFEASYYSLAYLGLYPKRAINFQNVKIQLESGDRATSYEPFKENGITEVKLANNELLDDNRETMLMPLLNSIKGFEFYPFEAETEGHGYYQVGDRITVSNGPDSWPIVITHIKLDITQGIKESISGVAPTKEQTDYARAGGIIKTIYNTEIKVDKQNQEIRSIVSRTDQLDNRITENYTQITQNINNITNTIQTTGGSNLLHNSVGYATNTERVPTVWTTTGTVRANTSAESLTHGAKSGSQITLWPSSSIIQTIIVTPGKPVSLSARVKKGLIGQATISISTNNSDKQTIIIADQQEYLWQEVALVNFIPELTDLTVKIETSNNAELLFITDLMLNVGDKTTVWQQANGEIHNTNVIIDLDGMIIKNSVHSGDYMKFTPLEIANYSNASGDEKKTFWLNRDRTFVQKLEAVDQISMPPIRIIPITETNRAGWAFVADKGEK